MDNLSFYLAGNGPLLVSDITGSRGGYKMHPPPFCRGKTPLAPPPLSIISDHSLTLVISCQKHEIAVHDHAGIWVGIPT